MAESSPAPRAALARARGAVRAALDAAGDFVRRVYEKAGEDNIFFMAGAIAFNVLVAFIPLVLAVLGIAGTLLRLQNADATEPLLRYVFRSLPPISAEFEEGVRNIIRDLVEQSTGLLSIGTIFLIWIATRLLGTLRTALREVFDIQQDRGIVAGKIFDVKMVIAAGTLFALNVGLTIYLQAAAQIGVASLGLIGVEIPNTQLWFGRFIALFTIWFMFLLIYHYLPARKVRWSTALIAATFTAVAFELMKQGFGWYVTNIADYRSTYGNLATLVILVLWIYYSSMAFVLGGEVAQVAAMQRIRRRQKERLR